MINEDKDTEFFCPALWKQRRMFILDVLTRFKIETVSLQVGGNFEKARKIAHNLSLLGFRLWLW